MRSTLILDTGAFIAAEHWNRTVLELVDGAVNEHVDILVPASVVAEAWRQPPRPNAAMLLDATNVVPLERAAAKRVGILLGLAGSCQVVDGSVAEVAISRRPSLVVTADPDDIFKLVIAAKHSSAIVKARGNGGVKRVDVLIQAL